MDAVVKETLRLCPPVPVVVRRLLEPLEVGGHELPAGTTVAPCVYLIHRNEEIYPQPRQFRPERFLEQPPGTYTWIPFGGGTRRCLAASYAELEMKRVLRTVLSEVELRPADGDSERARRSAISFSPDKRGRVIAEPRTPVPAPPPASSWEPKPIYS
jgi:cytochrome P450